jgi:hypothetical protein
VNPYPELNDFGGYYLEDSWVLDIEAHPGSLGFRLDFVLTPKHPDYTEPKPGEAYCYRRGKLRFLEVKALTWDDQGAPPATDASDELDYGNIDTFEWVDNQFLLAGDWGRLHIFADSVRIELEAIEKSADR